MPTFTDAIGVWNQLGSVHPQHRVWLKFPVTATGTNATFRAKFLCDAWNKLASYVLIRPRYTVAGSDQIGLAVRVFPDQTPVIFELPIPQDLQDRSIYFRDIEIYKVRYKRARVVAINPDSNLEVSLQELWG